MINVEKIDDVLIVSIGAHHNKLHSAISQQFKQEVSMLFDQKDLKMVLSLAGVEYIDSSGFGSLLSILRVAKNNSSQLKLCCISKEVMELVKLLQLHSVFDIRSDVDECLKGFK
ncbi:MAG TPA: STAS domain-containing protein [Tenuifilaceae bacterium]|nr:STAS domain-containing protein [Tenuifilaceae bacterium]